MYYPDVATDVITEISLGFYVLYKTLICAEDVEWYYVSVLRLKRSKQSLRRHIAWYYGQKAYNGVLCPVCRKANIIHNTFTLSLTLFIMLIASNYMNILIF